MLNRYQTGPVVTIGFFLIILLIFAAGLHDILRHHAWNGWLSVLMAILILFNFHKRFYRSAD